MYNAATKERNAIDHRQPQQPRRFQHLPNDVQRHILKLVIDPALKDIPFSTSHLTYAQVCRQWKSMVYSLIGTIDIFRLLHDLDSNGGRRADRMKERFDQVLCFLRKNKESIRSLEIEFFDRANGLLSDTIETWSRCLNYEALGKMLRAMPQLEALLMALKPNHSEAEALFLPSIKCLTSLKSVDLSESESRMRSHILNGLAEGCPTLEILRLQIVQVSDETMTRIGQLRRLQEFVTTSCFISDRGMQALCSGKGSIEILSLMSIPGLTNRSARAIATGAATQRHLKELKLGWAGTIDADGLCDILDRCERLSSLNLWLSGDQVGQAFAQCVARCPSRRLSVRKLQYFVDPDCTFPVENLHSLECLCPRFGAPRTTRLYWTESRVLGLSGLSNLRCLAALLPSPLWVASAVRALGQFPKLESLVIGNLDEAAVSTLIDCCKERLIRLRTGMVPRRCVQRIAKSFRKLTLLWMVNARDQSIKTMIGEWTLATVHPFTSEDLWEIY